MTQWVPVGKFLGPYGVKGWIKLYSYTHPIDNIGEYDPIWVSGVGDWQPIKISHVQRHGKGLVAKIEGCDDRESVPRFSGLELAIKKDQLPSLSSNDYYWSQLEGLKVVNHQNQCLGRVAYLMETGANDVLVVRGCEGSVDQKERLIPYLWERVVTQVNLDNKEMIVDWDPDF